MDKEPTKKIKQHFNSKYTDYDACCGKVVPRNDELQQILFQYLPYKKRAKLKMLDLGIGTGLTSWHALQKFPSSHIDGIDFSTEMIKQASKRLGRFNSRVNLIEANFIDYDFKNMYDVVFSAATIHNLPDNEKRILFNKIYNCLNMDGYFIKFKSIHLTQKTMVFYEKFLKENLADKELKHWLRHARKEDLPATIDNQFAWLKDAGFVNAECCWMYQNLAIIIALK